MSKQICKKLLAVMQDVHYLQKDGRNAFHKYKYVSETAVVEAVRDALIKHGIVVTINVLNYEVTPSKDSWLTTILTKYKFIDVDSGEELEYVMLGQGTDKGDKGAYKASTGVNKYVLMKALQIPTGDDPEKEEKKPKKEYPVNVPKPDLVKKVIVEEAKSGQDQEMIDYRREAVTGKKEHEKATKKNLENHLAGIKGHNEAHADPASMSKGELMNGIIKLEKLAHSNKMELGHSRKKHLETQHLSTVKELVLLKDYYTHLVMKTEKQGD